MPPPRVASVGMVRWYASMTRPSPDGVMPVAARKYECARRRVSLMVRQTHLFHRIAELRQTRSVARIGWCAFSVELLAQQDTLPGPCMAIPRLVSTRKTTLEHSNVQRTIWFMLYVICSRQPCDVSTRAIIVASLLNVRA